MRNVLLVAVLFFGLGYMLGAAACKSEREMGQFDLAERIRKQMDAGYHRSFYGAWCYKEEKK